MTVSETLEMEIRSTSHQFWPCTVQNFGYNIYRLGSGDGKSSYIFVAQVAKVNSSSFYVSELIKDSRVSRNLLFQASGMSFQLWR